MAGSILSGEGSFKRASSAEQLAEALRRALYTGELPPGSGLRDSHLAEQFAVSRGTMREAIQILAAEGLVDRSLHRTPQVRRLTPADVDDLYRVRQILETDAVRAVAEGDDGLDFAVMQAAAASLESAVGDSNGIRVVEADAAFHAGLVSYLEAPRLQACFEACFGELRLGLSAVDRTRSDLEQQRDWHLDFVARLEALGGDPTSERLNEVSRMLIEHLESAREMVRALVAESDTDGA